MKLTTVFASNDGVSWVVICQYLGDMIPFIPDYVQKGFKYWREKKATVKEHST